MTNYAQIWDRTIPSEISISALAGLTEGAINEYLKAHRKNDSLRYIFERSFTDGSNELFRIEMVVGGTKEQHQQGRAKPLEIALPNGKELKLPSNFTSFYAYRPKHGTFTQSQLSENLPNLQVLAPDVNIYLSWPNSTGGKWSHHVSNLSFLFQTKLELSEQDGRYSLSFVSTSISVTKNIRALLKRGLAKLNNADQKIDDLILGILQVVSSQVGPDLVENIELPAIEIGKFEAIPTAMSISNGVISIGAHLDAQREINQTSTRLLAANSLVQEAMLLDIEAAGGIEFIVFPKSVARRATSLQGEALFRFLENQVVLDDRAISQNLPRVARALEGIKLSVSAERNAIQRSPGRASVRAGLRTPDGMAVAINEATLDRLVSGLGNVIKKGQTDRASLAAIRGYLGYQINLGRPDISITSGNQLTGSIPIDLFAGLFYQLKQILDCSWRWGSERRIGVGIRGTPRISIRTVSSRGLSLSASVSLSGVSVYTGLGGVFDRIVRALAKPFLAALEATLNLLLLPLSFVVIPAEFEIADQKTRLALSRFKGVQYKRLGQDGPSHNFYLVSCDTQAKT